MHSIYLGLGSNLGDKKRNIDFAISRISEEIGKIMKTSSLYETEAWGVKDQDNYYNLVLEAHTNLFPFELLKKILEIETELGRIREKKWDARIIDIDILFFENFKISNSILKIPHPFIDKRNFVLQPLNEISPNFIHPKLRKSIFQLSEISSDENWIRKV